MFESIIYFIPTFCLLKENVRILPTASYVKSFRPPVEVKGGILYNTISCVYPHDFRKPH